MNGVVAATKLPPPQETEVDTSRVAYQNPSTCPLTDIKERQPQLASRRSAFDAVDGSSAGIAMCHIAVF